jgi:Xaa-Pro aminopeptidase
MAWTEKQIKNHILASKLLSKIIEETFLYIQKNERTVTEYEASQFIVEKYRENNLVTDKHPPIVSFGENTSFVHYFPEKKVARGLEENSPIMIDVWARKKGENSPYADITWMGFYGKDIPGEINKYFKIVQEAQKSSIEYIKSELKKGRLPSGEQVDNRARAVFKKYKVLDKFLHTTGHSLGVRSVHGSKPRIGQGIKDRLEINIGYTIEPALYFDDFGIRLELDFYISNEMKFVLTSPMQEEKRVIK